MAHEKEIQYGDEGSSPSISTVTKRSFQINFIFRKDSLLMTFSTERERQTRIADAMYYCAWAHRKQKRSGGGFYAVHPFRVYQILIDNGIDTERVLIAALLHDALEDNPKEVTENDIKERFGEQVLAIVKELTNDNSLPKPEKKAKMVKKFKTASLDARLVKAADRLDNISDLKSSGWKQSSVDFYITETGKLLTALKNIEPVVLDGENMDDVMMYGTLMSLITECYDVLSDLQD